MTAFEEIKTEILDRAHRAGACKEQYRRAAESQTMAELCRVIKDNFGWAAGHEVIDTKLLAEYREAFAENDIRANVSVKSGYLLCDGSATVEAYGSATVEAYNSATVEAYDSATVEAYDSATVEAYDSAYVTSFYSVECRLQDNALYRVISTNTVYYAGEDLKFVKQTEGPAR